MTKRAWSPERLSKAKSPLRKIVSADPVEGAEVVAELAKGKAPPVDVAKVPVRTVNPDALSYPSFFHATPEHEYPVKDLVDELIFLRALGGDQVAVYSVHAPEGPLLTDVNPDDALFGRRARDLRRRFVYHEVFYGVPEADLRALLSRVLEGAPSVDIAIRGLEEGVTRVKCRLAPTPAT